MALDMFWSLEAVCVTSVHSPGLPLVVMGSSIAHGLSSPSHVFVKGSLSIFSLLQWKACCRLSD